MKETIPWEIIKIYFKKFVIGLMKNISSKMMCSLQISFSFCSSGLDYHCYCEDGYTGTHCQTDWDECWSSPCANGAVCVDQVADFNCTCAAGFRGEQSSPWTFPRKGNVPGFLSHKFVKGTPGVSLYEHVQSIIHCSQNTLALHILI